MTHYRKKPVVIDAVQWDGTYLHAKQLEAELGLNSLGMTAHPPSNKVSWWKIATLEDGHVVSPMDWIITGVKGEHYPCKPDIFELTYETAEAQPEQKPEPVAWMFFFEDGDFSDDVFPTKVAGEKWIESNDCIWDGYIGPLYTHPAPVRQPLTHTEILKIYDESMSDWVFERDNPYVKFARAIEAAHGITKDEQ